MLTGPSFAVHTFITRERDFSLCDFHFAGQNLRNQIMTTNLWVEQYWYDHKLVWIPEVQYKH
jgi:hypothetical protein